MENTNKQNLIENLNSFVRITEEGKGKKSIGATIAKLVCNAYKDNDSDLIAFIEKAKEDKDPAFKAAKSYVSKGVKVGKAFQAGTFTDKNDQEVSTLYDILLKAEKEKEEKAKQLSEKRANDNAALLAVFETQDAVDTFVLTADPMSYAATLQQGQVILGEQAKEQAEIENRKALEIDASNIKAFMTDLAETNPDLFNEIYFYISDLAGTRKAA